VVGRVSDIRFDPATFEAVVSLNVDKRYNFPKDTFANIYTAGLLGEQYVGLEAGGDEAMLKSGDKITQTQDAVVLEKMISQFLYNKASEAPKEDAVAAPAASTKTGDDALGSNPLDDMKKPVAP
jgi:phospholipid/cholesterol/gamma-HCH transport system substrate-binding protein